MKNKFKKVLIYLAVAFAAAFADATNKNSVFGMTISPVYSAKQIYEKFHAQDMKSQLPILRNVVGEIASDCFGTSIIGKDANGKIVDQHDSSAKSYYLNVVISSLPDDLKIIATKGSVPITKRCVGLYAFLGHEKGALKGALIVKHMLPWLPCGILLSRVTGLCLCEENENMIENDFLTKWSGLKSGDIVFEIPIADKIFNQIKYNIDNKKNYYKFGWLEFYDGKKLIGVVTNLDRILEERRFGLRQFRKADKTNNLGAENFIDNFLATIVG